MSINLGNFSESLKNTFHNFSRQEAEAREHSRQLLLRLDRFETKALELETRTKKANQIKNHYERVLMHQHPILWAHIQRGLVYNIGEIETQTGVPNVMPTRSTKEMAINTSRSSSPSDENSLHEAVWPNSPSPYPGDITENLLPPQKQEASQPEKEYLKVNSETLQMEHLNITKDTETAEDDLEKSTYSRTEQRKELEGSYQPNFLNLHETKDQECSRRQTETEEFPKESQKQVENILLGVHQQESPVHIQSTENKPTVVHTTLQPDYLINAQIMHSPEKDNFELHNKDHQETNPAKELKNFKPFRLDSESDCPDDPISGPLSVGQTGEGDDSDSFWG